MTPIRKLIQRKGGLAIGLALALLAGIAQIAGWLDTINHLGFDLHSRWFGGIPADPRIVLVDIDDSSIRAMGEYPWPRRHFADLVRELDALDAERILLDVLFVEPGLPRLGGAAGAADEDSALEILGDPSEDEVIRDDDELVEALDEARVYLPAVGRIDVDPSAPQRKSPRESSGIESYLNSSPNPTLTDFLNATLPPSERQSLTMEREELSRNFRGELSRRAVRRTLHSAPAACSFLPRVHDMITPHDRFVPPSAGVGFAAYPREERGGVVRSVPVAVRDLESCMFQIGLLAAIDSLGISPASLECNDHDLQLGDGENRRTLPADTSGEMLVYWQVPPGRESDFSSSFVHLPAARLLEIAQLRRAMDDNVRRFGIRRAELMKARFEGMHDPYAQYARKVRRLREIDAAHSKGQGADPASGEEREALRRAIDSAEADAVVWLTRAHAEWNKLTPRDEAERSMKEQIDQLHGWFADGSLERDLSERNGHLREQVEKKQRILKQIVGGKICLVGYTATAVADLVTTPIHAKAPGVMVHANVINMVLQNRFLTALSPLGNGMLVAAAAMLAVLMACTANWRLSLVAMILICGGMWLLGSGLFRFQDLHIASLPAVAGAGVSWSGVTWYRQSTEERARRRFQLALTQYTSPAIASAIAEQVRSDSLAPRTAIVTCFFSDLEGFTRLSEQLGPARTRDVLNPYLELTSKILIEHGAIVNKFVGDGVFAFFNAPIRPCADHARQACLSASQLLTLCPRLLAGNKESDARDSHRVRVGLSTGEAFVGDYGSNAKLDYTCIGDTINLGSRLEQLNKILGTTILVDGHTRETAGNEFSFRPLGRFRIHGRAASAEVFEMLVGRPQEDLRAGEFANAWSRVVSGYQACQWDLCQEALAVCLRNRPGDRAVGLYWASLNRVRDNGVPSDWDGSLDLEALVGMEHSAGG